MFIIIIIFMPLRIMSNIYRFIYRETIQDTKWANLAPILIGKNIYVASEELQISQLVKDAKKMPELHMLGKFQFCILGFYH